jgi:Adenylylsulphate kinase
MPAVCSGTPAASRRRYGDVWMMGLPDANERDSQDLGHSATCLVMTSREDNDPMNGVVIWLIRPSGAGKSTIAQGLHKELAALGRSPEVLDRGVRVHPPRAGLFRGRPQRQRPVHRLRGHPRQRGVAKSCLPGRRAKSSGTARPAFSQSCARCSLRELIRRARLQPPARPMLTYFRSTRKIHRN